MEIGLKRLEVIRISLAVMRDVLNAPEGAFLGAMAPEVHQALHALGVDYKEVSALHEDISCRIKTIKDLETL